MKYFARYALTAVTVIAVGMLVSCQNSPVEPTESSIPSYQYVHVNAEAYGLAKGGMSVTEYIIANDGGMLDGQDVEDNFVKIRSSSLYNNLTMTFEIVIGGDNSVSFDVTADEIPSGEHIYFRDNKTSKIGVKKSFVKEDPNAVMHIDTGEIEPVSDDGEYWTAEVSQFSRWAWIILD